MALIYHVFLPAAVFAATWITCQTDNEDLVLITSSKLRSNNQKFVCSNDTIISHCVAQNTQLLTWESPQYMGKNFFLTFSLMLADMTDRILRVSGTQTYARLTNITNCEDTNTQNCTLSSDLVITIVADVDIICRTDLMKKSIRYTKSSLPSKPLLQVPMLLSSNGTTSQCRISWNPPNNLKSFDLDYYNLKFGTESNFSVHKLYDNSDILSLQTGTNIHISVAAISICGEASKHDNINYSVPGIVHTQATNTQFNIAIIIVLIVALVILLLVIMVVISVISKKRKIYLANPSTRLLFNKRDSFNDNIYTNAQQQLTWNREAFLITGSRDFNGVQMSILESILERITGIFKKHGAKEISTSILELKNTLEGKYGERNLTDIYHLHDQGGEELSLRYDLTIPFARYIAMNKIKRIKAFQTGCVYRHYGLGKSCGRFQEFYACDFGIAGSFDSMIPDAECLKIIADILQMLKFQRFVIKINHRQVLAGVFAACGCPADVCISICSEVHKLEKCDWMNVCKKMVEEKKLSEEAATKIGVYMKMKGGIDILKRLTTDTCLMEIDYAKKGLDDITLLFKYCDAFGITKNVVFDLSLVYQFDYYTGLFFEAVLTEPTDKESHKEVGNVGYLAVGGRYDDLVGTMKVESVPCVGFTVHINKILDLWESIERHDSESIYKPYAEVLVVSEQSSVIEDRMKLCMKLWDKNIKADLFCRKNPGIHSHIQYCREHSIPFIIKLGEERNKVGVAIIIMDTDEEILVKLSDEDLANDMLKRLGRQ